MRIIVAISSIIFLSVQLFGQKTTIFIKDANGSNPIPSAHVCFESENKKQTFSAITDSKGQVIMDIQWPGKVAISCIGYKSQMVQIEVGRSYYISLEKSFIEVGEVVVTGQATNQTIDKSIYQVNVINSKQINDKAANNLSEALSGQLTLSTTNNGILGKGISMLGVSGENVKILVDGIPVIGRQNGNLDLEQINVSNIDHIETIEGPMSVIYGSNALGGVINIISKNGVNQNLSGRWNGYYESVGTYNTDLALWVGKKNHHMSIDGGRKFFDGFRFDESKRSYDFRPKEQYFGNVNYTYQFKKVQLSLSEELFGEQLRNLGNIDFTYALDEYHFTHRYNTKFFLDYKPDSTQFFKFAGAYSYYNKSKVTKVKNMVTLDEVTSSDSASNDTSFFDNWFFRGTYAKLGSKTEWLSGFDGSLEQGNGKRLDATKKIDEYAAFTSLKYHLVPSLWLQGGLRAIYNTKYKAPVVYSFNALWQADNNFSIRASVGSGFRSPSIKELYLNFVDVNHNVHGNPDLKAEKSLNFNLLMKTSFGRNKSRFEWQTQFYHNRIKEKIDLAVLSNSATEAYYININGTSKTVGLNTQITYKLHPRLVLTMGVIYGGKSKLSNLNEYTFTPDAIINMTYQNVKYKFRINIDYKYFGKETQYLKDSDQESWIASYQMMNLGISRPFWGERISLGLGIKNLLDYKQIDQYGSMGTGVHGNSGNGQMDISWGRSYYFNFSYRFSKMDKHE